MGANRKLRTFSSNANVYDSEELVKDDEFFLYKEIQEERMESISVLKDYALETGVSFYRG